MIWFSIGRDERTGDFEIVLWKSAVLGVVVQANIRTKEKADVALSYWQQIERDTRAAPRS